MRVYQVMLGLALTAGASCMYAQAQVMPATQGETLSGKKIVLVDAVHGHSVILVAGFSHEAGMACGDWIRAIHSDPVLAEVEVYEVAMLEGAPGLLRGMIKNAMRKGMSGEEQARSVVLAQDDKLWRQYFGVSDTQEPQVILLDAKGTVLWHGHGAAAAVEPQLREALGSH